MLSETEVDVYVGTPALPESATGYPIHRDIVASAERIPLPTVDEVTTGVRRLVVKGLNDRDAADVRVRIPIASTVDSLNVATPAAIGFSYASR